MKEIVLSPELTVAQVCNRFPETIRVLIVMKTDCIGCLMMKFCTLEYVAREYQIEVNYFIKKLEAAILEESMAQKPIKQISHER